MSACLSVCLYVAYTCILVYELNIRRAAGTRGLQNFAFRGSLSDPDVD